jgi:Holliday junction DNA helicase RuvB
MFYGPPGTGKTTLSNLIADDRSAGIIQKTGQEVEHKELLEILESMNYMDILFIDEIHSTPIKTMEILYGPLQIINNMKLDNCVSEFFIFEKRFIRPFTLIGATTSAGSLSKPLRDRIILSYQLELYGANTLANILVNKGCNKEAALVIARRSRGTPRLALNYYMRLRNEFYIDAFSVKQCETVFKRLGISPEGFDCTDREIIKYLQVNKVASADELCRSINLDKNDYLNMYENWLLRNRLIKISSKGRSLTEKGEGYRF